MTSPSAYYRKGFGLRAEVQGDLAADYEGQLVTLLREREYTLAAGDVTLRLAREFGFCYGVERAVEYAYQTRRKFPDKRLFLVGEIIHNPHVNARLAEMGIDILLPRDGVFDFGVLEPNDVVILPAFGVTIQDFERLRQIGCVLVDTTCGSVLNVWKRVESYARDGFTALIHGKHYHEETRATASQVLKYPDGRYLVVRRTARASCSRGVGRLRPRSASAPHRRGESDDDARARVARDRRGGRARDRARAGGSRAGERFPNVRYDLQRDPGAAGCGARAARGAARRDARHRGLQLQQYHLARRAVR
jgi:hypothetical protein